MTRQICWWPESSNHSSNGTESVVERPWSLGASGSSPLIMQALEEREREWCCTSIKQRWWLLKSSNHPEPEKQSVTLQVWGIPVASLRSLAMAKMKKHLKIRVSWAAEYQCKNDKKAVCRQPHTRSVYCTPVVHCWYHWLTRELAALLDNVVTPVHMQPLVATSLSSCRVQLTNKTSTLQSDSLQRKVQQMLHHTTPGDHC